MRKGKLLDLFFSPKNLNGKNMKMAPDVYHWLFMGVCYINWGVCLFPSRNHAIMLLCKQNIAHGDALFGVRDWYFGPTFQPFSFVRTDTMRSRECGSYFMFFRYQNFYNISEKTLKTPMTHHQRWNTGQSRLYALIEVYDDRDDTGGGRSVDGGGGGCRCHCQLGRRRRRRSGRRVTFRRGRVRRRRIRQNGR